METRKKATWLAMPYGIWMVGFIIVPLIMIIYYGFTSNDTGAFTLDNIKLIATHDNLKALWLSVKLSLISTFICFLIAYPLALILRKLNFGGSSFLVMIIILPMWMNSLLRTIAWQNILEKTGILNAFLSFLGMPNVNIINTPPAIVLGMVYDFLPFMILPVYNVIDKIDENVINAARDLGASYFQTLVKIIFPLSIPGVISGITMVFVPSLTTFVISTILGGSKILLIGNVIEQYFQKMYNWNAGSGLSLVLMIFILISMAVVNKYDKEEEGGAAW
jgi:spermidine/putrescine transport system permease protein